MAGIKGKVALITGAGFWSRPLPISYFRYFLKPRVTATSDAETLSHI